MQTDNIPVLSTRLLGKDILSGVANEIAIDTVSFINVNPIDSNEIKNRLQALATQPLAAIFTSSNAVSAVAKYVSHAPLWKFFCTSGKTKETAVNHFGEKIIVASAKNASLLAGCIIAAESLEKPTFFCGDQRLNVLPEQLRHHNIPFDEIIVYTTVQTPVFIEKNYSGILFFSPSAVHSFFSINTLSTDVVLFSIGETTTAAIETHCANRVETSAWPGTKNLVAMANNFFYEISNKEQ